MVKDELQELFTKATLVGVFGGIAALLVSALLTPLMQMRFMDIAMLVVVTVGIILLAKHTSVDNRNYFQLLVFLLAVSIVGSIVSLIYAPAAMFVLSVNIVTLSGIAWTILYVQIGEVIVGILNLD